MGGKGKGKGKSFSKGDAKGKGKGDAKGKGKGKGEGKWVKVKPTVLVTGATGFVAMSCVRRLLDRNYKVRGTVRSLADEEKLAPLKRLFPKLELFEADLLGGSEAFEKAMAGCTYVLHTASPFQTVGITDPQKQLIDPALKGTEAVMNAAVKAGVTRVVLTSSMAACGPPQAWTTDYSKADNDKVFSEEDWNETSSLTDGPYRLSKSLAEKKAWEIAEKADGLSLSTILPSFVIGPMMTDRADATSIKFIKETLDGTKKAAQPIGGFPFGVVDVRDVSLAHVSAMESDEAAGKRFICSSETGFPHIKLVDMIRDRFKAYPLPTEGDAPTYVPKMNTARAKEILKFDPRPVEVSLRDMANSAIRNGIVEKKVLLKPVSFGKVGDIEPEQKGINLVAKVVSLKDTEDIKGKKVREVVVGDATGIVTMRLAGEEVDVAEEGKIVEVRNAAVRMFGGFIRLQVGKWGKFTRHEGDTSITPNMDKDASEREYELVAG